MILTELESKVLTSVLSELVDTRCDDVYTSNILIGIIDKLNTEIL